MREYRWIRDPFHRMRNETGKRFIFGHHPTRLLHEDQRDDIWISPCKTKIAIDGAADFGGKLHGLEIGIDGRVVVNSVDAVGYVTCKEILLGAK